MLLVPVIDLLLSFQPVSLELGGKSPILVFEDVDIEKGLSMNYASCTRTFCPNKSIYNARVCNLFSENVFFS